MIKRMFERLFQSQVWRSMFRHGLPESNRTRAETVFYNFFLHVHPTKVRKRSIRFTYTWGLGGLSLGLFIVLTATGALLMLYYRPSVPQAYWDMKDLQFVVSSGQYLRNMHRWAAHAMVAVVFLHMLRVFYTGSYRSPKEFNWVIGVFLLVMTILLSYTGYLLPWDQLSFWGISVGTNMVRAVPFGMGETISFLLLGGNVVGENALIRFYVLHCFIVPVAAVILMGIHFWRVRKDGGV
ncbi:MAG: cytochrome B6 [Ignavibacteria bacterium GWA2_55_11]|nr:MAG: cytochrome B6 [Ignavibacteria bacterium GWA2_55_11]OGU45204.1 MAG: cytochrome B6 [Ignavibacteria bacterium GWC2_56_12]OGU68255.1 MAG: cytochrome B6 [Ignavibacteria bacterium RIFCSPHIGHO2_02_FULL_56_12]OGU72165.1 MAG: cytochrome B6 [Ignavibacteria bacterium RIFCSPLOWO2_12_FULL_56_21]OGU72623.1 MAG: cytochrome B6 [Ignavibacteria bacterium RIFCSPLOWO2_02_FULL_55_14]